MNNIIKMLPDYRNCNSCFACAFVCPKKAISIQSDQGKENPEIDKTLCIQCGKCVAVCPSLNDTISTHPDTAYAAVSLDESCRELCSSGGLSEKLAESFIQNDGVVFGAEILCDGTVQHTLIDNVSKLEKMRGSKYARSNIENIYAQIESYLKNKKDVLFFGTPCQVAGIKSVFDKKYSTLYTVDLVCHGIVPNSFLKKYLSMLPSWTDQGVSSIQFRGKAGYALALYDEKSNLKYRGDIYSDLYMNGFYYGWLMSHNCFNCKFASSKRVGDITLGDFWGVHSNRMKQYNSGISLVLLNSEKGSTLFDSVKQLCDFEERPVNEAINGNSALRACEKKIFLHRYFSFFNGLLGFEKAIRLSRVPSKILVSFKLLKVKVKTWIRYRG